jgi:hypothetical protein
MIELSLSIMFCGFLFFIFQIAKLGMEKPSKETNNWQYTNFPPIPEYKYTITIITKKAAKLCFGIRTYRKYRHV